MKRVLILIMIIVAGGGCTKTLRVARPTALEIFKQRYNASANDVYYALRWALKTYGYPIAEEDLRGGILRSRYVPVRATSHYIAVFDRKDFGVSGAYHKLEVRVVPLGGLTEVQIGSTVQGVVSNIRTTGREEKMILRKLADYLGDPNAQITNLGVRR